MRKLAVLVIVLAFTFGCKTTKPEAKPESIDYGSFDVTPTLMETTWTEKDPNIYAIPQANGMVPVFETYWENPDFTSNFSHGCIAKVMLEDGSSKVLYWCFIHRGEPCLITWSVGDTYKEFKLDQDARDSWLDDFQQYAGYQKGMQS